MRMLARREFSAHELRQRLRREAFTDDDIEEGLDAAKQAGWLSESRFTASRVRHGVSKGWGPLRIWQELQQHQISRAEFNAALDEVDVDWFEVARVVKNKKFGETRAKDAKALLKQQQFLRYRGFNHEQIDYALGKG